jgi:glutamine---fructose-6-phosphate transaminase (isomerizing)
MRKTMVGQPAALRRLLDDRAGVEAAAAALRGRRIFLVGTGTSWHAANQGAHLLRVAGVEAWAVQAADAALDGPRPTTEDGLILLSHRGTKRYTRDVLARARQEGGVCVVISGQGAPGADLETVPQETSSAFTASHLGALLRLAQLAVALGADLGDLAAVPDAVEDALGSPLAVRPPARGLEFVGGGINQWTAAEGALKVRETSKIFTEGLSVEQLLHGPAVALGPKDTLVSLDGGGLHSLRLAELTALVRAYGTTVHEISAPDLGEPLSIFPLTVTVQRVALECAEALGSDPDSFGRDDPVRRAALDRVEL